MDAALAPLVPLGPPQPQALQVRAEPVKAVAPLLWGLWTGESAPETQPNPAPNRAVAKPAKSLIEELSALTTLAQAIQQTSDKVTEAHATFLRNQGAALDQIQAISHLLQSIGDER